MTQNGGQVPWTDEQWARVNQVVQEEASRARVAATFLPLYGPLSPDTDFVRDQTVAVGAPGGSLTITDVTTIPLATLQVRVELRGAQVADPDMASALLAFRRAANILARLEDAIIFRGQNIGPPAVPNAGAPPGAWQILGGRTSRGLFNRWVYLVRIGVIPTPGDALVAAVSQSIGNLESRGHFGPFAVVLGEGLFLIAQTALTTPFVLPQDSIIPFLGGGPLVRSSALPADSGVVVALGGEPVELVIATDVSVGFLQITQAPVFVFRVFEKMVLRIKEPGAIVALVGKPPPAVVAPNPEDGANNSQQPQ
jgi:uncharacterized linocin/CFP29 family protein